MRAKALSALSTTMPQWLDQCLAYNSCKLSIFFNVIIIDK